MCTTGVKVVRTVAMLFLYCSLILMFAWSAEASFTFNSSAVLQGAVDEWVEDEQTAEGKYGSISTWDVSEVTDMFNMFGSASVFNADISSWDVSKVTSMLTSATGTSAR
eukprot:TRINITY_DN21096_c1_g1_i5.p2 TRINITY_DN21096_c1_g1~~TRINITY_DN21096_c1_g1_i5.p2  ORF type:complete len:109 (-),score=20.18 TRINITY_DN21096_c1_g1_i5:146-472(-)